DSINNQVINSLQGIVHTIKGEAFALGFKKLADVSGNTESLLKQIINKKVTFEKNIQILEHIEKLNGESEKLHSLVNKLFSFAGHSKLTERERISLSPANYIKLVNSFNEILNHFRDDSLKEDKLVQLQNLIQRLDWLDLLILEKALTQVNEKSAVENNKNSKLNIIYDIDSMPLEKFRLLRESLIHLIRNSIAHGIEEPSLRSAKKKDEAGKINIHIYKDDKNYNVLYTDDGAGFNIKKIKQKAIENKLATEDVLRTLSEKETIKFVFNDSFSTSEKTDVLSGVGAGMAVVRNNILNILKGKLELTNRPGRGISIKIVFPA
ncbi:MAG: hypothetical protein KAJ15_02890, partial [Spirochaetes bacterium]|nr:hypothetical protein [Spirochaetota bacterium]